MAVFNIFEASARGVWNVSLAYGSCRGRNG